VVGHSGADDDAVDGGTVAPGPRGEVALPAPGVDLLASSIIYRYPG